MLENETDDKGLGEAVLVGKAETTGVAEAVGTPTVEVGLPEPPFGVVVRVGLSEVEAREVKDEEKVRSGVLEDSREPEGGEERLDEAHALTVRENTARAEKVDVGKRGVTVGADKVGAPRVNDARCETKEEGVGELTDPLREGVTC